ncbi:hypothetical protein SODALDRAFT_331690 [Sodiomyces alkalinus F11]|uniref:Uncharacterized protein n=1 Tax=Sodiomyces alkalinus (strain CBS 110278 / VKM F-3762 / F11) TaxID=1314773 RepID=A0A3N2PYF9_SODAK|nr:hypothetical protein SODALDRAFT_331690 [Sodiomyces alkalinus F11]ROT39573.1 hypothetical protein SODALDRAFT_331690 [Sodiomyces alkalinus F11]
MSLAPVLAARGIATFPGTCKIDISAKLEGCVGGVEIIIGRSAYDIVETPDYITITPTKYSKRTYGHHGGHKDECDGDSGDHDSDSDSDDDSDDGSDSDDDSDSDDGNDSDDENEYGNGNDHDDDEDEDNDGGNDGDDNEQPEICREPTLSLNLLDLVDLDLFTGEDITLLADILGIDLNLILAGSVGELLGNLVDNLGDTLGGLLGGLLGGRPRTPAGEQESDRVRSEFEREFTVTCGSIIDDQHANKTTAEDLEDCLARCEATALELTLDLGLIYDCLGVSLDNGVEADNCLFIAGQKVLDLELNLGSNPNAVTAQSS